MKAAMWYGRKDIRIVDAPLPELPPGHVLIRVAWAGICGTDRHEYTGPNFIPVTKPHRLTGRTAPLILGHEFAGIIAETGPGVEHWRRGDRVTANGTLSCGACEACRRGRYNICEKLGFVGVSRDGAFAEYVSIEAARLFPVPPGLSLRHAVLAEPLACGLHAARLLGDISGRDVAVVGPGVIGLACFFASREAGAGRILVAGMGNARRELVESCGGVYVDAGAENLREAVRARFGGAADIAYECVGLQSSLDSCLDILKPSGALMVMGVYEKPPVFRMNDFQEGERRLFTSQAHVDEIAPALGLLAGGAVDAERLITGEVTLDTLVRNGFEELLAHGEAHIKVLIRIGGE
ncbi:MAG: alcohol dehydrogenase catalytic domain-containing protein [Spirochaetaceae bacterium]|jgi:(R,R)-butanediol dehydrogenase/meso-butanediol dehydrogenase/diacetyl reductase|nr:alcohol dehydrogenase catalytic domain-containing protein [Spirochaetaceae bacterium]